MIGYSIFNNNDSLVLFYSWAPLYMVSPQKTDTIGMILLLLFECLSIILNSQVHHELLLLEFKTTIKDNLQVNHTKRKVGATLKANLHDTIVVYDLYSGVWK